MCLTRTRESGVQNPDIKCVFLPETVSTSLKVYERREGTRSGEKVWDTPPVKSWLFRVSSWNVGLIMNSLDDNNNKVSGMTLDGLGALAPRDPQAPSCFWCLQPSVPTGPEKCLRCREEIYACSLDHWKYHQDLDGVSCFPFVIDFARPVGRFMTASRDLQPGDLVFREMPLVVGPASHIEAVVCIECLRRCDGRIRCEDCNFPLCSTQCPLESRLRLHRSLECPVFQRHGFKAPTSTGKSEASTRRLLEVMASILPLRLILSEQLENSKSTCSMLISPVGSDGGGAAAWSSSSPPGSTFLGTATKDELEQGQAEELSDGNDSQRRDRGPPYHPTQVSGVHERMTRVIREEFKLGDNEVEIWSSVGKMLTNAKSLEGACFGAGSGLFERYAMMNHSCIPNTKCTINAQTHCLELRAQAWIAKGQEITTRYVSFNIGLPDKQIALKRRWHFRCLCKRCQDPLELESFVSALKCESPETRANLAAKTPCHAFLVPRNVGQFWACTSCPAVLSREQVIRRLGNHSKTIGCTLKRSTGAEHLETLLEGLALDLHPNHFLIQEVKYLLLLSISRDDPDLPKCRRLVRICEDLLTITSILDPGHTKNRGNLLKHFIPAWRRLAQMELDTGLISQEQFQVKKSMSHQFAKDLIACFR